MFFPNLQDVVAAAVADIKGRADGKERLSEADLEKAKQAYWTAYPKSKKVFRPPCVLPGSRHYVPHRCALLMCSS